VVLLPNLNLLLIAGTKKKKKYAVMVTGMSYFWFVEEKNYLRFVWVMF